MNIKNTQNIPKQKFKIIYIFFYFIILHNVNYFDLKFSIGISITHKYSCFDTIYSNNLRVYIYKKTIIYAYCPKN